MSQHAQPNLREVIGHTLVSPYLDSHPSKGMPRALDHEVQNQLGLYLHIPFCEKKCPYCDFNTYAGLESSFGPMVDALCAELVRWQSILAGWEIDTIFIGGGTPTVLPIDLLTKLFHTITHAFDVASGCEITCEANPGTVDRGKFAHLRNLGINRLSMGVQSFHPEELQFLGRIHDTADVYEAFDAARRAGFDNINLDFIFGLPSQDEEQAMHNWKNTLTQALSLVPEHLSLYSLIVEPNTPLSHWVEKGTVAEPDGDLAATMYEMAIETLQASSNEYRHYEVSNWAKDDTLVSQHNLKYWRNQFYLGIGPGAHSHMPYHWRQSVANNDLPRKQLSTKQLMFDTQWRWGNRKPLGGYMARIQRGEAVVDANVDEAIDRRTAMGETMMMGLRLVDEGVSIAEFYDQYQTSPCAIFAEEIQRLQAWGLLQIKDDNGEYPQSHESLSEQLTGRICLTQRGLMLGNQVFAEFI
ncbi:MAG: radical SAM family heme chaperone HemW [Chloroflexota bacterium]